MLTAILAMHGNYARGSHIGVACGSIHDRDQNGIKRSTFLKGKIWAMQDYIQSPGCWFSYGGLSLN